MTTIKEDNQSRVGWQGADQMLMQRSTVDHSVPLEIHGHDSIIKASLPVARYLSAVPGVMQETHTPGLGDQPCHRSQDIVPGRIVRGIGWIIVAVGELNHAPGLFGISPRY